MKTDFFCSVGHVKMDKEVENEIYELVNFQNIVLSCWTFHFYMFFFLIKYEFYFCC